MFELSGLCLVEIFRLSSLSKMEKVWILMGFELQFFQLKCKYLLYSTKVSFFEVCFVFHLNEFGIEDHVCATVQSKGN